MCYDTVTPSYYEEQWRRARKPHVCCECQLNIAPGEQYEHVWGVWDGQAESHDTCEFCAWLRSRLVDAEVQSGCRLYEAHPGFGFLLEGLAESGGRAIGMLDLLSYEEGRKHG